MSAPRFRVAGTVLSARDVQELAGFYERLLGWPRIADEPGWVILRQGELGGGLSFHEDEQYEPPVWPSESGSQMMMFHLDIATDDLEAGVARAIECGATVAAFQPQPEVRVMLDPAGHPFCLFPSPHW